MLERQRSEGAALIAKEAVTPEAIRVSHSADMQFVGQTHILNVPLPSADVTRAHAAEPVREGLFRALQGRAAGNPRQSGQPQHLGHRRAPGGRPVAADRPGRPRTIRSTARCARFARSGIDGSWRDTPVYAREKLPLDAVIAGPAILEQMDATTVLEPGDRARSDADGNIIIEIGEA